MTPQPNNEPILLRSESTLRPNEQKPLLSVVIPCMNEELVIRETCRRLITVLGATDFHFELIFVDDGSKDGTPEILRALQLDDPRVRVVRLSRNFGHQVAITAGLEHAGGDAAVVIDADLQDPPELLSDFAAKWLDGYDVVYGVRIEREGESVFKLWTAKAFYRIIGKLSDTEIPLDTGDFRLMDRRVVDALLAMPERDRFVRGMVSWLGFSQISVPYRRAARFAGETKYPLYKMLKFATDGIVSFSVIPLRLATWMGFLASALAVLGIIFSVYARIFESDWVKGWTSTVIAILFLGGVQLLCLGIIGEYIGRIYGESKRRPLYVVHERLGFDVPVRRGARSFPDKKAASGR